MITLEERLLKRGEILNTCKYCEGEFVGGDVTVDLICGKVKENGEYDAPEAPCLMFHLPCWNLMTEAFAIDY